MNNHALPALALILAAGILFGYVNRAWSGPIAATKTAIANNEKALIVADEYTAKQNELASARNAIDPEDLTRLSVFLPDSVDNIGLILDINALAARSGISLTNVNVVKNDSGSSGNGAKTIGSIDLSLSAVGTYAAFQTFLAGIEKSARLLDIMDIIVKGSDTGVYNYQMAVRLYWLR